MVEQSPSEEFLSLVDEMTTPAPTPSATIRVAEFHFGENGLAPIVKVAGLEVVASLDAAREIPNFEAMPEFDVVVAEIPDSPKAWPQATDYLIRFLFVRRPMAFAILGSMESGLQTEASQVAEPYGYEVSLSQLDGLDFILGISERDFEQVAVSVVHKVVRQIREAATE